MDETLLAATYRKAGLYDQAHWYDTDYAGYLAENAFYENAVKKCIGPGQTYLELGAGTGRLALRYLEHPIRVHAVEPAPSMLERLKEKARKLPEDTQARLTTELADAHGFVFCPDRQAQLITFPFNGILHIHGRTGLQSLLAHLKTHLASDGFLGLDITAPAWTDMDGKERAWGRLDERVHPDTGATFLTYDRCYYEPASRLLFSDYRFIQEGQPEGVELSICQYMWTFQEILHAVEQAGFQIEEQYGDVDFREWGEQTTRLLLLAQRISP